MGLTFSNPISPNRIWIMTPEPTYKHTTTRTRSVPRRFFTSATGFTSDTSARAIWYVCAPSGDMRTSGNPHTSLLPATPFPHTFTLLSVCGG